MKEKNKLLVWHIAGAALAMVIIRYAHFIYDNNPCLFTSLFFPVNESIWEHNKLFVLPVLPVYLLIYAIIGRKYRNYIPAALFSLIIMPLLSSIFFELYLIIAGTHHAISGIVASILILIAGFTLSWRLAIREKNIKKPIAIALIVFVVVLIIAMAVFTYYPPKANFLSWLFMDTVYNQYGILN